jgi:hypothetical protein
VIGDPWSSHSWVVCRLEIKDRPRIHYRCSRCSRDFTEDPLTGERSAVYVSVFNFWKLPEPVVKRWLGELCPGAQLQADIEVRSKVMPVKRPARERGRVSGISSSGIDHPVPQPPLIPLVPLNPAKLH